MALLYSGRLLPLHEIARAEAEMSADGEVVPQAHSSHSMSSDASPSISRSRQPPRKNKRMLRPRTVSSRNAKRSRSDTLPVSAPLGEVSSQVGKSSAGVDRNGDVASFGSTACSPASSGLLIPASVTGTAGPSALLANAGAVSTIDAHAEGAIVGTAPYYTTESTAANTLSGGTDGREVVSGTNKVTSAGAVSMSTTVEGEVSNLKASKDFVNDSESVAMLKLAPLADAEGIVWTKIKGHPYWPSQIVNVTPKLLKQNRFQDATRFKRRTDDTCVQYFGTLEIAWVEKAKMTISWTEGVRKKLHLALSKRHRYRQALDEVKGYCSRLTKYPENWWCEPISLAFASDFIRRCSNEDRREHAPSESVTFNANEMWTIARSDRVVWAKVRGFPDWPVQIMNFSEARRLYPELKLQSPRRPPSPGSSLKLPGSQQICGGAVPCMFFGTGEVANIPERCIVEFDVGVDSGFVTASERHDFRIAIGEAYGFLQMPRIWPSGYAAARPWWNAPNESESDDEEDEEKVPPSLPKYEFLRRSIWPEGESPPPRAKRAEIPVCVCSPNPSGSCVDASCLNVMSSITCDPGTCPAGETCKNLSFHRRPKRSLMPFFTSDSRGWGLRTLKTIPKGEFVCEYVGEIVDKAECARRLKLRQRRGELDYYMMEISSDHVLDASEKGNLSRFINSSCAPNCETQKWNDAATGQTVVGIFSLSDISAGTELLYNYCFEDFGLAAKKGKRAFICRCGSDACCMYEKGELERTRKLVGRRLKVRWDDGWYFGRVQGYSPAEKAYTVLYDDGDTELLGLGEKSKTGGNAPFKFITDSKS